MSPTKVSLEILAEPDVIGMLWYCTLLSLNSGSPYSKKGLYYGCLLYTSKQPLYRVNLAAVISKYIGETEKNLRLVFSRAEKMGAVLLFDEADALLGKRSNVRDAHDKYANQEVAYLLQKMETYPHHIFVQCKNGDCIGVLPGFVLLGN